VVYLHYFVEEAFLKFTFDENFAPHPVYYIPDDCSPLQAQVFGKHKQLIFILKDHYLRHKRHTLRRGSLGGNKHTSLPPKKGLFSLSREGLKKVDLGQRENLADLLEPI